LFRKKKEKEKKLFIAEPQFGLVALSLQYFMTKKHTYKGMRKKIRKPWWLSLNS
jgi:hypothetical protein